MICTDFWCGIDDMHPVAQRIYSLRYNPDSIWHSSQILWRRKKTHLTQQSNPLKTKKHIFLLSRLLGVVYQAGGPVTRRPTKRKISFKNKHCLALLLFLNCFIFFSQRKPHQKHEKGKIESSRCIRALWQARQDQRPHWQIYQKEKTPGRFKRCIQITFQCPLFVL